MRCLRNWCEKVEEGTEKRKVSGRNKEQNSTELEELSNEPEDR